MAHPQIDIFGGCAVGLLVDGQWVDQWYETAKSKGRFVRSESQFRNWITEDGSEGPSGIDGFKAEPGRYHLYVSLACPWAHRTLIMRSLKELDSLIDISIVHWHMADQGWTFERDRAATGDQLYFMSYMHQIYTKADPDYSGRVTVPVLWDKHRQTIVSNESSEIIRMLNSAFDSTGAKPGDYWPKELRDEIESVNERIYNTLNNGVYRCGFATTQEAYDEAIFEMFDTLDWLEERLQQQRYLCGDHLSEADIRLFTTLVRFDPVYVGHFKCNLRRLIDYPALFAYVCDIYQQPGVATSVDFEHIKNHYYGSHTTINPTGIVPRGPLVDFTQPHGRAALHNAK